MRPEDLAEANDLLANPREVDLSVSQRLGLHVVARLAQRHHIEVSLTPTPGCGVTSAIVLPPELFAAELAEAAGAPVDQAPAHLAMASASRQVPPAPPPTPPPVTPVTPSAATAVATAPPRPATEDAPGRATPDDGDWLGWWEAPAGDGEHAGDAANGDRGARPAPAGDLPGVAAGRPPTGTRGPAATVPRTAPAEPRLTRRVPQAHLAPELRRQQTEPAEPPVPPPDADQARQALSRYQASREAARALVDRDPMDGNGHPPDRPGHPPGSEPTGGYPWGPPDPPGRTPPPSEDGWK
jgi:hypothetical protein